MELKRYHRLLMAVFSGILFCLAWTQWHLGPVLFIAFIPLLFIEDFFYRNKHRYRSVQAFFYSYIAFFTWNIINTWWIYYATIFGAVAAVVLNSLFMAIVFWIFHGTHRRLGNKTAYFALIMFWLAFELIHLNWDLSWAWLTMGNGFSRNISLIQWYEFTGALGGSLWILVSNILIFMIIKNYLSGISIKKMHRSIIIISTVLVLPLTYSLIRYYTYNEKKNPYEMIVVQPNIDPYNEKFDGMSEMKQLEILLNLADQLVDENTDFVVCPETALPAGFWEEDTEDVNCIEIIKKYLNDHPNLRFVIGASTFNQFDEGEELSVTARHKQVYETDDLGNQYPVDYYYDAFNSAIQIEKDKIQIYHKSKLVLGVEMMPYPEIFSLLGDFAVNLGGTSGGLGVQKERSVFTSPEDTIKIGVPVCYESIFGQYFSGWVTNGAHFIFVITNDGWWEDTPGYRQHLSFSALRAIETRRSIARSANTGISCFINQRGEILQATDWWVRTAIKGTLNANDKITFYTKYGDYLGRIAVFLSVLILLYSLVKNILYKRKNKLAS